MVLLVLIEIPVLLFLVVVTNIAKAIKETANTKAASPKKEEKQRQKELSKEQREQIIKAILEDSLLENDRAWDALVFKGEATYPAAGACRLSEKEFDLEYGSKAWTEAWTESLTRFFDCHTEYAGCGNFRIYGKEA